MFSFLSSLIDGNPANAKLLCCELFFVSMIRFVDIVDDEKAKMGIKHLLLQLLRFEVTPKVLNVLLSKSNSKSCKTHVVNGSSVSVAQNVVNESDDLGCQLLYILGISIERPNPPIFFHFGHSNPLYNNISLVSNDRIPPPKIGFSVISWVRLGNIGNTPISTFMQIYFDSKSSTQVSAEHADFCIDIYFRSVYKSSCASLNDAETISVSSETTAGAAEYSNSSEDSFKKVLQLCVSYRTLSKSGTDDNVSKRWDETLNKILRRSHDHTSEDGMNALLTSSLVSFLVPDVVIDFDWTELGSFNRNMRVII